MNHIRVACDICTTELLLAVAPSTEAVCPVCETRVGVRVFAAAAKEMAPGQTGEKLVVDEQSSCFYHPAKKASVTCQHCGRFLCSLCDIDMNGRHLCSGCIESGADTDKVAPLTSGITCYDDIALSLTVLPILLFYFTFLTAPAAFVFSLWHWRKPRGFFNRVRWRFVVAIILSVIQMGFWVSLLSIWVLL